MTIIKFIVGTIISIVALAIATKIAAFILGIIGVTFFLAILLIKLVLAVAVIAFVVWVVQKLLGNKSQAETI